MPVWRLMSIVGDWQWAIWAVGDVQWGTRGNMSNPFSPGFFGVRSARVCNGSTRPRILKTILSWRGFHWSRMQMILSNSVTYPERFWNFVDRYKKHEICTVFLVTIFFLISSKQTLSSYWSFEEKTFVKQSMISEWEKCAQKLRFALTTLCCGRRG